MKALTICQPYAHFIAVGAKPIENRTWPTAYRGPLAIHAGKSRKWLTPMFDYIDPKALLFGAALGIVTVTDCVRVADLPPDLAANRHACGPWCWILTNPRPFKTAVPLRGWHRLWEIPDFDPSVGDIKGIWEASRFDWVVWFALRDLAGDDRAVSEDRLDH